MTDAIMSGLPPHIAQVICGHKSIDTTIGYKAVYPAEAIEAHRAFIARRRATRPSEQYRTPTDAEWEEFLGHFERRKVALGDCGRAYGTACVHEMACERCSLLPPHRPRPAAPPGHHPRQPGRTGHRGPPRSGLARRARRPSGLPRDGQGETAGTGPRGPPARPP